MCACTLIAWIEPVTFLFSFFFPVHKLFFISPANDGSTIVKVPEFIAIDSTILTIKVNLENVTYDVTGEHSHLFYVQGKQLKTAQSFKNTRLSFLTLNIR